MSAAPLFRPQLFNESRTCAPCPRALGGVGLTLLPRKLPGGSNVDQRKTLAQQSTRHSSSCLGLNVEGSGTGSAPAPVDGGRQSREKGSLGTSKGVSCASMLPNSAAGPSANVAVATIVAVALGFQDTGSAKAQEEMELPYVVPAVTTKSDERAITLARQLKAAGVEMYGAFWCNHCYDQKQKFGVEAMADFPYVECYPDGYRKGIAVAAKCDAANLKGFPTWVFGAKRIEGEQPLRVLEKALKELEAGR